MLSEVYEALLQDGFGQRAEPGQFYFEVAAGRLVRGLYLARHGAVVKEKEREKRNEPKRGATAGRITKGGEPGGR